MILILQLDKRASELGEVFINKICKLVAGQDGLLLKYADISPCIDEEPSS